MLTDNPLKAIIHIVLHLFRPHLIIRRLEDLDCNILVERGIRGVMLDLDNTLVPWGSQDLAQGVIDWVEKLREAGLRGCIVTNASRKSRVRPVAERLGLPWITTANKPLPWGFTRGMAVLGTTPHTSAMVGDLMTMDVLGGKRLGIFTILVEPLSSREALATRILQRPIERLLRFAHRRKGHFPLEHRK